jgi:hypothetical protein
MNRAAQLFRVKLFLEPASSFLVLEEPGWRYV